MNLEFPSITILSAKPNSGKSHWIKGVVYEQSKLKTWDIIFCFTPTKEDYEYLPTKRIFWGYTELQLAKIIKYVQEKQLKALIIFDDMLGSISTVDTSLFKNLISTYRHLGKGISIMITTQNPKSISPLFRNCATYSVMFAQSTRHSIKALYESYGTGFKDEKSFKEYLDANTENYAFVLYNGKSKSNNFNDIYRSYRFPAVIPKFKIDC